MVGARLQKFSGQSYNKNEHGWLRQIDGVYFLLVDQADENEDALLGSNLDELVGITGQDGDVGKNGESRILAIAEYSYQGFVLLVFRYLHEEGFDQLHVVLNKLCILVQNGGREQVVVHSILGEKVHHLRRLLSVGQQQVQALQNAHWLFHIGFILQQQHDEPVLAEGDEKLL